MTARVTYQTCGVPTNISLNIQVEIDLPVPISITISNVANRIAISDEDTAASLGFPTEDATFKVWLN